MSRFIKILSQNIFLIVLVAGIVVAVNYLASQNSKRIDLTEDKEYTLSHSTEKVLSRLEDRLTIKMFVSKDMPAALNPLTERIEDVLREYQAHSKYEIAIEHVIADLNDEKEKDVQMLGINPFQINVQEKDKLEIKKVYLGMALYYQDKQQIVPIITKVNNLEYILDLSVLKLTQKQLPKIGVFIGENSDNYSLLPQVINEIGELVEVTSDVKALSAKGLDALMIINPVSMKKDFLDQVDALIAKGKSVYIFAGTVDVDEALKSSLHHTGLDDWLAAKGLGISQELLLDIKQNVQLGFQAGVLQIYKQYPFWVRVMGNDLDKKNIVTAGIEDLVFPWTNVIELYGDKDNPWSSETLVRSSETSFLEPHVDGAPDVSVQYIEDMTQLPTFESLPLSVVLTHKDDTTKNEKYGRLFATASSHVLEDKILQQFQSNVIFISNLIESSTWGDYLIDIRSRGKTARPLKDISYSEKNLIKWGVTLLVPVFAVILGLTGLAIAKKRRERFIAQLSA